MQILIYAYSMAEIDTESVRGFELLQDELQNYPTYSVLLMEYGRLVSESSELKFYGSGIGALEECLRVCVPERHARINFYLGQFYMSQ